MEKQLRCYLIYRLRNFTEREKQLKELKKYYEERKQDIIDESPTYMDGQPHGKGKKSDPVQSKVVRIEALASRIDNLEAEINGIKRFEESLKDMDSLMVKIYKETIRNQSNLEHKAMDYGMGIRTLYNYRTKLLKLIAEELGEYIEIKS